jgi:hypothetical protein
MLSWCSVVSLLLLQLNNLDITQSIYFLDSHLGGGWVISRRFRRLFRVAKRKIQDKIIHHYSRIQCRTQVLNRKVRSQPRNHAPSLKLRQEELAAE